MKKVMISVILAGLIFMAGCVPLALNGIADDKNEINDPNLVGLWQRTDGKEVWQFTDKGKKGYKLVHIDEGGKTGSYEVRLVKLGEEKFLDVRPGKENLTESGIYQWHLVSCHSFIHIREIGSKLAMELCSLKAMDELLKQKPDVIKHVRIDDKIILTATTKELQEFLLKHIGDEKFYDAKITLVKAKLINH